MFQLNCLFEIIINFISLFSSKATGFMDKDDTCNLKKETYLGFKMFI